MEGLATPTVAKVALEMSIQKTFDYEIPEALANQVVKGVCVEVPVRGFLAKGFVVDLVQTSAYSSLRPVTKVIGSGPVVTSELFELALWMSRYYLTPLGKVLKTMLPAGVRKNTQRKIQYEVFCKKSKSDLRELVVDLREKAPQQARIIDELLLAKGGILLSELLEKSGAQAQAAKALSEKGYVSLDLVRHDMSPFVDEEYFKTKPKILREEQAHALDLIVKSLDAKLFAAHLLFGITGSGKTEVYLQAIDRALKQGLGVIMLVPEIALTPQTIQHFKSRFDVPIAALHHRLSDGERLAAWEKIQAGTSRICLGARSAVFCPMPKLGLIIVDEEHEHSYKQTEDSPSYSARDVAVMRAKFSSCTVVLGSATPSIETYHNALNSKYTLSILKKRSQSASLPKVHVVDMKPEFLKAKGFTSFSDLLLSKIEDRRQKGEQSILFLNRRGYHTVLTCTSCGKSSHCPHCAQTLTFHMQEKVLTCHLCGYSVAPKKSCTHCSAESLMKFSGVGTEKVEAMLHGIFPGIQTLRIDADTTRHKGRLEELLQEFRAGKAEVVIGTQMIAKGLHFPQVTLVGVLNCDKTLNIPDFRSQESVFQLITQVAGRAGRGHTPGEVVVQTTLPEHSTILHAASQDYAAFYEEEITTRQAFYFPPYCRMVKFLFASKKEDATRIFAEKYAKLLQQGLSEEYILHPPVPAGHAKVKDYFRFQFLLRGPSIIEAVEAIERVDKQCPLPSSFFRYVDVDPSSTFF